MPEKNKTYRARIDGYTSEGLGVARIDGQVVFVHDAVRGEDCDILVMKVLKNVAFGKPVLRHSTSPHRQEPDCPYYGRCGGCDFRHLDYAEELWAKRQRVQDALARLGDAERTCITLQLIDGYSIDKISNITGLAEGTVKSHLSRGKSKLAIFLKKNGYDR